MSWLRPWKKKGSTTRELMERSSAELVEMRNAVPGPPGGSGFMPRVNNRSMAKTLETLERVFAAAESVNQARASFLESKLEVDRALALLDDAETIHEADADERFVIKANARMKRNQAEMDLMRSDQALADAKRSHGIRNNKVEAEIITPSQGENEYTEDENYATYRKFKGYVNKYDGQKLNAEAQEALDTAMDFIREYEAAHQN